MSIITTSNFNPYCPMPKGDIAGATQCPHPPHETLSPCTSAATAIKDASNSEKSLFGRTVGWLKCAFAWVQYLTLSFLTLGIYALVCKFSKTDKIIKQQAQEIKALKEDMRLNEERHAAQYHELNDKLKAHEGKINKFTEESSTLLSGAAKVNTSHFPESAITPQHNNGVSRHFSRRRSTPLLRMPISNDRNIHNCCGSSSTSASLAGPAETGVSPRVGNSRVPSRYCTPTGSKSGTPNPKHTPKHL